MKIKTLKFPGIQPSHKSWIRPDCNHLYDYLLLAMDSRLSSSIELFLSIVQFTSGNNTNKSWLSSISIAQNSDRLLCCDWLTLNLSHEYFSSLKTIHRSKLSFSEHSKISLETRDQRTRSDCSRTKRFGPVLGPGPKNLRNPGQSRTRTKKSRIKPERSVPEPGGLWIPAWDRSFGVTSGHLLGFGIQTGCHWINKFDSFIQIWFFQPVKCSVIIYTNKITTFSIAFSQPKLHLGRQVRQSRRIRSKVEDTLEEFG